MVLKLLFIKGGTERNMSRYRYPSKENVCVYCEQPIPVDYPSRMFCCGNCRERYYTVKYGFEYNKKK